MLVDKVPAFVVKEDGHLHTVYGSRVTFVSRRESLGPSWPSERRVVVVPLYWNAVNVIDHLINETVHVHHPDLEVIVRQLEAGQILRTYPTQRLSPYYAVMHVGDVAGRENGFGRSGMLLNKDRKPVVVTVDDIDHIIEIKGVGLAKGDPFLLDFGRHKNKPFGSLVVAEAEHEFENLNRFDLPFKAFVQVNYDSAQGTVGYLVRLNSLGTVRASYQDFRGLSGPIPQVPRRSYVQYFAEGMAYLISQGYIHGAPHPDNVAVFVDKKPRSHFSDCGDILPLNGLSENDVALRLHCLEEIGCVDRREFLRVFGQALLGYSKISLPTYQGLKALDTTNSIDLFYRAVARFVVS